MNDTMPEIIIKHKYIIDLQTDTPIAIPEILIVANQNGYRWLSEFFKELSEKDIDPLSREKGDPDDHQHIESTEFPFNANLSDACEIRLGLLDETNREAVFDKYGISEHSCQKDLVRLYRGIIDHAEKEISKIEQIMKS